MSLLTFTYAVDDGDSMDDDMALNSFHTHHQMSPLLTYEEDDGNGVDDDSCEQLPHTARCLCLPMQQIDDVDSMDDDSCKQLPHTPLDVSLAYLYMKKTMDTAWMMTTVNSFHTPLDVSAYLCRRRWRQRGL